MRKLCFLFAGKEDGDVCGFVSEVSVLEGDWVI